MGRDCFSIIIIIIRNRKNSVRSPLSREKRQCFPDIPQQVLPLSQKRATLHLLRLLPLKCDANVDGREVSRLKLPSLCSRNI